MEEDIIYPEKELEKVRKALRKYDILLQTSRTAAQHQRIEIKISELKLYEEKIQYILENRKAKNGGVTLSVENTFIDLIRGREEKIYSNDYEINTICLYFFFFYQEFLSIFSERKMRLDFKYSLERDNFHHRYQDLARRVEDYLAEYQRLKDSRDSHGMDLEMRRRNLQVNRNLFIDMNKFYKRVNKFALELMDDLADSGLICLNGNDIINFELSGEKHYLEGHTVSDAIHKLHDFVEEVISYLNIPEIEKRG